MGEGLWARLVLTGNGGVRVERLVQRRGLELWWENRRRRSGWPAGWPVATRVRFRPARWYRRTPELFLEVPVDDLQELAGDLADSWGEAAGAAGELGHGPAPAEAALGERLPVTPEDLAELRPGERLYSAADGPCRVVRCADQGRQVVIEGECGTRRAVRAAELLAHFALYG